MSLDVLERAPAAADTPNLDRVIQVARSRMRLNRALATAGPALLAAGLAAIAWLLVGRVVVLPDVDVAVVAGGVLLAVVAVGVAAAVRIPDGFAAWAADRWLATNDAFSTAVELREGSGRSELGGAQIAAAEARAMAVTELPSGPNVPTRALVYGIGAVLVWPPG